jgi:hypothetical protein
LLPVKVLKKRLKIKVFCLSISDEDYNFFSSSVIDNKHKNIRQNIPKEAGLLKFLPVNGGRGRAVSLCDR